MLKCVLRLNAFIFASIFAVLALTGCQNEEFNRLAVESEVHSEHIEDDLESEFDLEAFAACRSATGTQVSYVNLGASKRSAFLSKCYSETGSQKWCDEIARPNPESSNVFHCTYSVQQAHVFVHPEANTWKYAIGAVQLVKELEAKGVKVSTIYNWWRPEPYNKNVGGAAGRHPYGTSVDVRFADKANQNKAHAELCKWRKAGRLRALGYYAGTGLHLGMGDSAANTWGKACP